MKVTCTRYHDFSCGHRVVGHEGHCRHLHGHNYRVHFTCSAWGLDSVGRVIDFAVIKSQLCAWLEMVWDHKMLLWEDDPYIKLLPEEILQSDCVPVPFNPTAENMATYLLNEIGPLMLNGTGVDLIRVVVEETRKCQAEATWDPKQ